RSLDDELQPDAQTGIERIGEDRHQAPTLVYHDAVAAGGFGGRDEGEIGVELRELIARDEAVLERRRERAREAIAAQPTELRQHAVGRPVGLLRLAQRA